MVIVRVWIYIEGRNYLGTVGLFSKVSIQDQQFKGWVPLKFHSPDQNNDRGVQEGL